MKKRTVKHKLSKTDMCHRCSGQYREVSPPGIYCTDCRELLADVARKIIQDINDRPSILTSFKI